MRAGACLAALLACACGDSRDREHADPYERPPLGQPDAAPLVFPETAPEALVTPQSVEWRQEVVVGRRWWHRLTVGNVGREPLRVSAMGVDGDGFRVRVEEVWLEEDPTVLGDPDGDGTPGVVEGGFFEVKVYFEPLAGGRHEGTFWLRTNDPRSARHEVSLVAMGLDRAPCAPLAPDPLDFGEVASFVEARGEAVVSNCNEGPLHILAVETAAGPVGVDQGFIDRLPLRINAPQDNVDQPSLTIPLRFSPRALGRAESALFVRTDDPDQPQRSIAIVGQGVRNRCPTAVVAPRRIRRVGLGEPIRLDGSGSTDPEGQTLQRAWGLRVPPGSSAALSRGEIGPLGRQPPTNAPVAIVYPDMVGRYVATLDVGDPAGNLTSECGEVARVPIDVVVPESGLLVELTWEMERTQQGEPGTDLDVHLKLPGQAWFSMLGDSWVAGPEPPYPGAPGDGPTLFATSDGGGPEVLRFAAPFEGDRYGLAVHYFRQTARESGFDHGASTATVRVYADGELVWTSPPRRMEAVNGFWIIGDVDARGRVRFEDRYLEVRP